MLAPIGGNGARAAPGGDIGIAGAACGALINAGLAAAAKAELGERSGGRAGPTPNGDEPIAIGAGGGGGAGGCAAGGCAAGGCAAGGGGASDDGSGNQLRFASGVAR